MKAALGIGPSSVKRAQDYELWRTMERRVIQASALEHPGMHIVCDVDKTYLETRFHSLLDLAKIAFFERAKDKITVEGAAEFLQQLRWSETSQEPRPLHFVSASPVQLRQVLSEKMLMDALDWSSSTFKDQAYNLRKAGFASLRQQVAYKTAAILSLASKITPGAGLFLIGDDAEADPYIYLGLKLYLEGFLGKKSYGQYLEALGVHSQDKEKILNFSPGEGPWFLPHIAIRRLGERKDKGGFPGIFYFQHYHSLCCFCAKHGLLSLEELEKLSRSFCDRYAMAPSQLLADILSFASGSMEKPLEELAKNMAASWQLPLPPQKSRGRELEFWRDMGEEQLLGHCISWIQENYLDITEN